MIKRFLKLCLFVAIVLLVAYYFCIIVFGSEDAPPNVVSIWCVGFFMIVFAIICIGLLVAAYKYVVTGW